MFLYEGGDAQWHENASPEDIQSMMQAWESWMQALSEKGQLISGGDPLHHCGSRLTSTGLVTDIAASEYKDLVSGYSVISANSMEEAIEIGRSCPVFSDPTVTMQIREIFNLN